MLQLPYMKLKTPFLNKERREHATELRKRSGGREGEGVRQTDRDRQTD